MTVPDGFPRSKEAQARGWSCMADDPTCTRAKPCAADRGRLNQGSGRRKQRIPMKKIEQMTGVDMRAAPFARAHEEDMRGPIRIEVKSGKQCNPAASRFLKAEAQSEAARPVGDLRPFVHVLMPEGWGSEGIVQFRLTDWAAIVDALAGP